MAFDMYAGERHESIEHHEEFIFYLAGANDSRYSELLRIWRLYYDGPRISSSQAGELVHELIELLWTNGGFQNKALSHLVIRLLPFFSAAYRNAEDIKCTSD